MNRDKIRIKMDKKGNAIITGGADSFVAKCLQAKGKLKIKTPMMTRELNILPKGAKLPEEKPVAKKPVAKPVSKKPVTKKPVAKKPQAKKTKNQQ